jgi:hypothetical protein
MVAASKAADNPIFFNAIRQVPRNAAFAAVFEHGMVTKACCVAPWGV